MTPTTLLENPRPQASGEQGVDVIAYTGLAVALARRYAGRGEQLEDLKQVAMLALVKAASRFDASRGISFSTYATATVDGELKRHFRQRWGLHVRRGDQERYLAVREADEVLTHRYRRRPTVSEIAAATGIERNRVEVAINVASAFGVQSLEHGIQGAREHEHELADPSDPFERFDQMDALRPLLAGLPDRDREILRLRFGAELPQTEIARRLGISQMQVSRTLARVLNLLRRRLSD